MKFVPSLFCSAFMVAAMLNSSVRAEVSTPPVTLPDCCTAPSGTVTADVYNALPGGVYYGTVVINGVSYPAWCLRPEYFIFPAEQGFSHPGSFLHSTCAPYLADTLKAIISTNQGADIFFNGVSGATQQKFVALNWIINNRVGYTASQVQAAIWNVLYEVESYGSFDFAGGAALAALALQYSATHASFDPTCGKIGWVLEAPPQLLPGFPEPFRQQLMLLEVPCPELATIGDKVWIDANKNGIQDGGEAALPNVTVKLYACAGNTKVLVDTDVTDANGIYGFTVQPGSYSVEFVLPSGYVFTTSNVGSDDAKDSDADSTTGSTACVTVGCGEANLTIDAGVTPVYSNPGTGTPGYWKNHPEAWPVNSISIGGVTYTKAQALAWLGMNDRLDKRVTLFRALLCAKLNVVIGNDPSCIDPTIILADAWWTSYGGAFPLGTAVPASSYPWQVGKGGEYATKLDNYNNGLLCAPHRN